MKRWVRAGIGLLFLAGLGVGLVARGRGEVTSSARP